MTGQADYLKKENEITEGRLVVLQMDFAKIIKSLPHYTPLELSRHEDFYREAVGIIERLNYLKSILYRILREMKKIENFDKKYLTDFRESGMELVANKIRIREKHIVAEITIVIQDIDEYMHYWMRIRDTEKIPRSRVMRFVMKYFRDVNYFSDTRVIDVLERILAKERDDIDLILQLDRRVFSRRRGGSF